MRPVWLCDSVLALYFEPMNHMQKKPSKKAGLHALEGMPDIQLARAAWTVNSLIER